MESALQRSLKDVLESDKRTLPGRGLYGLKVQIKAPGYSPIYIYCKSFLDRRSLKADLQAWSENLEVKTFRGANWP